MKIRLSNSEFIMIDTPTEINQQELYGLIQRLTQIMKFFSKGDVFNLKENNAEQKQPTQRITRGTSLFGPIKQDRKLAIEEMKFYLNSTLEERKKRAEELQIPFEWYPSKISELRKKFKFSPKELGVTSIYRMEKTK